jgi:hypothetical protein
MEWETAEVHNWSNDRELDVRETGEPIPGSKATTVVPGVEVEVRTIKKRLW